MPDPANVIQNISRTLNTELEKDAFFTPGDYSQNIFGNHGNPYGSRGGSAGGVNPFLGTGSNPFLGSNTSSNSGTSSTVGSQPNKKIDVFSFLDGAKDHFSNTQNKSYLSPSTGTSSGGGISGMVSTPSRLAAQAKPAAPSLPNTALPPEPVTNTPSISGGGKIKPLGFDQMASGNTGALMKGTHTTTPSATAPQAAPKPTVPALQAAPKPPAPAQTAPQAPPKPAVPTPVAKMPPKPVPRPKKVWQPLDQATLNKYRGIAAQNNQRSNDRRERINGMGQYSSRNRHIKRQQALRQKDYDNSPMRRFDAEKTNPILVQRRLDAGRKDYLAEQQAADDAWTNSPAGQHEARMMANR